MSYGPQRAEPYGRLAFMVDKILKGSNPANIPVEQPTKFQLVINLNTAKQIGLDDSAERAGTGGQCDQVSRFWISDPSAWLRHEALNFG